MVNESYNVGIPYRFYLKCNYQWENCDIYQIMSLTIVLKQNQHISDTTDFMK